MTTFLSFLIPIFTLLVIAVYLKQKLLKFLLSVNARIEHEESVQRGMLFGSVRTYKIPQPEQAPAHLQER